MIATDKKISRIKIASNLLITKVFVGAQKVFSMGAQVTYKIDNGNEKTIEVENGVDATKTFTPTPPSSDWEFAGWRSDTTANGSIITSKTVEDDTPFTLYAVFRKQITVNFYSTSTAVPKTDYMYYNNGNTKKAQFRLKYNSSSSEWTPRGWSTSTAGNASITYDNDATFERDTNINLYGSYSKSITLSYNGNGQTGGSVSSESLNVFKNYADVIIGAPFVLKNNGFTKTNYTFINWAQGSTSGTRYEPGASITLTSNTTFYAIWTLTVTTFNYTGGAQSYTVPINGIYKIEVWAADGGASRDNYRGGKGGYGTGRATLSSGTVLSIVVGGMGAYPDGKAATYSEWGDSYANDDGSRWWDTEHESYGSNGGSSYVTAGSTTYIKCTGGTGGHCYWDDNHGNVDDPSEGGETGSNGSVTIHSSLTDQSKGLSSLDGNGKIVITFIGSTTSIKTTTYSFAGAIQSYTVPVTGNYKFEVWGANGGDAAHTYKGGKAGYGVGTINLTAGTVVTIQVGGTDGYPDGKAGSYSEGWDYYLNDDGSKWWDMEHNRIGGSGGTTSVKIGSTEYIKCTGGTGAACWWDDDHGNLNNPEEGGYAGVNGSATVSTAMSNRSTGLSTRTANDGLIVITRL